MAGVVTLQVDLIKGGATKFGTKMPFFLPSPIDPQYSEKIVFEGIGVDIYNDGKQGNMEATVAIKVAVRECIAYLGELGYTREQAYLLLSAVRPTRSSSRLDPIADGLYIFPDAN